MAGEETRERILNAAERLFALRGIASTSMRALTKSAEVNLAAVHYHFGSKEALLDAVIERRAEPLNAARNYALDRHLADRAPGRPDVERVLRAFLEPVVEKLLSSPAEGQHLPRLIARVEAQPPELLEALYRKHFGTVSRRFVEALQRALPQLPKEIVSDRFRLAMGSIFALFSGNFDLDCIPDHPPAAISTSEKLARVISYATGGLCAPHPGKRAPGAERAEGAR
jgi:AcrR family transcriptional regulator